MLPLPDLSILIYLHAQVSQELSDRAIIGSAIAGEVDNSAFSCIAIRKCETHPNILGWGSAGVHEPGAFVHVLDQYCLLD